MNDPVQTRSHETRMEIAAPLSDVWDALTKADLLTRWFGNEAREAQPGGRFFVSWFEHGAIDSPITVFEPLKHLRFEDTPPGAVVPFATDFYLEAKGGLTVLRIVASGFSLDAKWDGEFDALAQGWGYFIRNLRFYLERFGGKPCKTIGFPVKQKAAREDAFGNFGKALGLDFSAITIGVKAEANIAGFGKIEVWPDLFRKPGHVGLIMGADKDALLRIENFNTPEGGWAYVMGLDWNKDTTRMEKLGKALRVALGA
jgi:uncharacterized protein YndB with AHSA1/START domain